MRVRNRCAATCIAVAMLAQHAVAKTVEEVVDVTVTVADLYNRQHTRPIKVTVFRDDAREKSPYLILNHGRPANPADSVKMGRVRYSDNARYFVSKGFVVFVPTRIGYGETGGDDIEYSGNCQSRQYAPVYDAAATQTLKVIELARTLAYVDGERGLVVGQSFGGMTAIAVAAKNVRGVLGAVNFAGGGGGNPVDRPGNPCRADLLEQLFATYGQSVQIPTLWLYSENDKYFGNELPQQWFKGFLAGGSAGEFHRLPPLQPPKGEDGHATFTRDPDVWRPAFESFLRKIGF